MTRQNRSRSSTQLVTLVSHDCPLSEIASRSRVVNAKSLYDVLGKGSARSCQGAAETATAANSRVKLVGSLRWVPHLQVPADGLTAWAQSHEWCSR